MFNFLDFLYNLVSGLIEFLINTFTSAYRVFIIVDDLAGVAMNAVNSMPSVFFNFAVASLCIILACGIVRFVTGGG